METGVVRGRVLVSPEVAAAAKASVLGVPGVELTYQDDHFPQLGLLVPNIDALRALRALPVVDYVEPAAMTRPPGADAIWMSWSCGADDYSGEAHTVAEGDSVSARLGGDIEASWVRASGAGVTISFVGTGVSEDQPQLNADFTGARARRDRL